MRHLSLLALSLGCALTGQAVSQAEARESHGARFAAPKRIHAGKVFAGQGRYYPSPTFHDVDGDGTGDLVIGDLAGRVTYARGVAGKPGVFTKEVELVDRDGKPIVFSNW